MGRRTYHYYSRQPFLQPHALFMLSILPIIPVLCPVPRVPHYSHYYAGILGASLISSVHEKIDGYTVGQHPLVSKLMKGIFHERPPQPRYTETWDVSKVTTYLVSLGQNDSLTLFVLTHKTVMLLALNRPCRSADLCQLDLQFRRYLPEGVSFQQIKLSKQSRQAKPLVDYFFQLSLTMNTLPSGNTQGIRGKDTAPPRGSKILFSLSNHC